MSCTTLLSADSISIIQGSTQCTVSVTVPTYGVSCSQQMGLDCAGTSCTLSASVPIVGIVSTDIICDNTDRTTIIDSIVTDYTCQCPFTPIDDFVIGVTVPQPATVPPKSRRWN